MQKESNNLEGQLLLLEPAHQILTLILECWLIFMLLLSSADFFHNWLFQNILLGTLSEYFTVRIQIRPDILSGLIWVQSVCKGYQQMKKFAASKEGKR